jgi:hypothetical protein
MKNDSIIPIFVVSLVFGGFVYFEMNRKIEELKNDVVNLQIHLSQREARNVHFTPTQGFYNGR